jgi:RNA polymerase sigma-70 factor (ECF subfamily)
MDGRLIAGADPRRGRFRAFLKSSLDNFVINQARSEHAQSRGGNTRRLSLGTDIQLDQVEPAADEKPEDALDRHWRRAVLDQAIALLDARYSSSGRPDYIAIFRRYDLAAGERPTYDQLGAEFGLARPDIDTRLRRVRKDLVAAVREVLATTVDSESGLDEEVQDFFRGAI